MADTLDGAYKFWISKYWLFMGRISALQNIPETSIKLSLKWKAYAKFSTGRPKKMAPGKLLIYLQLSISITNGCYASNKHTVADTHTHVLTRISQGTYTSPSPSTSTSMGKNWHTWVSSLISGQPWKCATINICLFRQWRYYSPIPCSFSW